MGHQTYITVLEKKKQTNKFYIFRFWKRKRKRKDDKYLEMNKLRRRKKEEREINSSVGIFPAKKAKLHFHRLKNWKSITAKVIILNWETNKPIIFDGEATIVWNRNTKIQFWSI